MTVTVVFTGPAGSGKTFLTYKYGKWLEEELLMKVAFVNLDPGAENVFYKPVFDIRSFFTLKDIMIKYSLGPNGAFIKASQLIAENIDEIFSKNPFIDIDSWDIVLIDTPGQMETFIFREYSNVFFNRLRRITRPVIIYIVDASSIEKIVDMLTMWFIHILIFIKTGIPTIPIVNKIDQARRIDIIKNVIEKPDDVFEKVMGENSGLIEDILKELISITVKTKAPIRTILVSAIEQNDYSELHSLIHEVYCVCGDLT
ncbi:MAG: ATP/GTP-binding protein [Desulfurococcaceae archaeon]